MFTTDGNLIMKRIFFAILCCVSMGLCFEVRVNAGDKLLIHEWGTFTSFQDEEGRAFARINTDDEPVPKFVHQLFYSGRFLPTDLQIPAAKGARQGHPEVTMRLETPVTYFHLPSSAREMTIDVSVAFSGGWLTEYFPKADAVADQKAVTTFKDQKLTESTTGQLTWKGVRVGATGVGPATDEHVWQTPRQVQAAQLSVGEESERFLFYRGVGHRDAPLRVIRKSGSDQFEIRNQSNESAESADNRMNITNIWLVQVRPDGGMAFRRLPSITLTDRPDQVLATTSVRFEADDFSMENVTALQKLLHSSIVAEGLFEDEATALLETWRLSYFQSPGIRLFFLVPQSWTDRVLPMTVSVPAKLTRVMIGRIEIVTPEQRELVQRIAKSPPVNLSRAVNAIQQLKQGSASDREKYNAFASGRGDLNDLNVPVPESYQMFLALGRFRTSLILNELADRSRYHGYLDQFANEILAPAAAFNSYQRRDAEQFEIRSAQQKNLRRHLDTATNRIETQVPARQSVVFLGDEMIKGWNLAKSFPQQPVTQYGYQRFYASVFVPYVTKLLVPLEPRLIVIHDGLSEVSMGVIPEKVVEDLRELIDQIHEKLPKTKIVLLAPTLTSKGDVETLALREVRRLLQRIPHDDNRVVYVDLDQPMVNSTGQLDDHVVDALGHLNDAAYERWTRAVTPFMNTK